MEVWKYRKDIYNHLKCKRKRKYGFRASLSPPNRPTIPKKQQQVELF